MITQCCYLEKYDWLVKIFYEVGSTDTDLILKEFDEIDCEPNAFYSLANLLEDDGEDQGFTYTDQDLRISLIVMTKSSSASEFRGTFDHEKGHAVCHIGRYFRLDPYGEEIQYLSQDLSSQMFQIAQRFMCEHCRVNFYNYGKIKIKI